MQSPSLNLLLADDDSDDRFFFQEALKELTLKSSVYMVNDGEQLMAWLTAKTTRLPDVLFLDLNMPRKNGIECLIEIKFNEKLKQLPLIIYSTSMDNDVVNFTYEKGASGYIKKPGDFRQLTTVINKALTFAANKNCTKLTKEKFVFQV